jgi:anti-sigma B factor antagonist
MSFVTEPGESSEGVRVLALSGQLDAHACHILKDELNAQLERGLLSVVLDCSRLEYISSAGLGVLKQMTGAFSNRDGVLCLSCVPAKVATVLDLLGFSHLIRVYASNRDAIVGCRTAT